MASNLLGSLLRIAGRVLGDQLRSRRPKPGRPASSVTVDYDGCPSMEYGHMGPGGLRSGEVVWTWVVYEDDERQGKDRPVLLIGTDGDWLLGLPATSQDHDRDAEQERRAGRYWVDIGTGSWDSKGRASEVRADRIVRVDPARIRRASGRVSQQVFAEVARAVRKHRND